MAHEITRSQFQRYFTLRNALEIDRAAIDRASIHEQTVANNISHAGENEEEQETNKRSHLIRLVKQREVYETKILELQAAIKEKLQHLDEGAEWSSDLVGEITELKFKRAQREGQSKQIKALVKEYAVTPRIRELHVKVLVLQRERHRTSQKQAIDTSIKQTLDILRNMIVDKSYIWKVEQDLHNARMQLISNITNTMDRVMKQRDTERDWNSNWETAINELNQEEDAISNIHDTNELAVQREIQRKNFIARVKAYQKLALDKDPVTRHFATRNLEYLQTWAKDRTHEAWQETCAEGERLLLAFLHQPWNDTAITIYGRFRDDYELPPALTISTEVLEEYHKVWNDVPKTMKLLYANPKLAQYIGLTGGSLDKKGTNLRF